MALTAKQEAFAIACAKGSNASDAYRAVYSTGRMSAKSINEEASHLLANPKVASRIAEFRAPALAAARLDVEETERQLACVVRSDPRKLYRADGSMIPVHELDAETAAAISSVEVREEFEGQGESRKLVGYTKKIKFWDKTAAINMAMRHLGQFERDNSQRMPNLAIQVNLVGPEPATTQVETKRLP
jgi:phage terminase small subunit